MFEHNTVLVTGVGGYWGARVAARLLTLPDLHVMGLDTAPPAEPVKGLDFVQADIRNPLLTDLLREEGVDCIAHLAFVDSDRASEAVFDLNVMGTMKVFGAAAAAGVPKLVWMSSTMVYGAQPDNSAFLPEERVCSAAGPVGAIRDLVEIEAFCNGFRGQNPDISLTVLRFPNIVGPQAPTRMTRWLASPVTPVLMGFDPLMQVIHEDDVVEALVHAVLHDVPGVFNVAAEDTLPFSRLRRLAGKHAAPIFHLAAYWGNPMLAALRIPVNKVWPLPLDYIRYPWVADLSRMRRSFGFTPRYTAEEALREFAGRKRLEQFGREAPALEYDAERLRDTIERRRRLREPDPEPATTEPEIITDDIGEEVA